MAFEVTATRRRPQQWDSLAGQEFVVSTLKNAIASGRIAHAYLFSGPRGVGKTTSARLLAKALNCQHGPTDHPCGVCDNCLGITRGNSIDVIEIDGASNTGVNDVRVIKEEVMFPPTSSRYKIYIIDEVHMLSQSAFNALLKTIEEPPEYVIFIFATTETQKVPATIRSRCQQFNFQLIGTDTIKKCLSDACAEMNIKAEDDALFWIAKEGNGSMRDAYTLFDQIVSFSDGNITLEVIREKLGLIGLDSINAIMLDIVSGRPQQAMDRVHALLSKGVSIDQTVKDFTDYFRSLLLIRQGVTSQNVLGHMVSSFPREVVEAYNAEQLEAGLDMFLDLYRDIRYSLNQTFELELAISRLSRLRYVSSNATVLEHLAKLKNDLMNGSITPVEPKPGIPDLPKPVESKEETPEVVVEAKPVEQAAPAAVVKEAEPVSRPVEAEPVIEVVPACEVETADPVEAPDLKDCLPQGVSNVVRSDGNLVLEFDNRFYYEVALRNLKSVRERVQKAAGGVNVVVSFSEKLEAERKNESAKAYEEAQAKKREAELAMQVEAEKARQKAVAASAVAVDEEHRYFVDDLVTAFKGHEEK